MSSSIQFCNKIDVFVKIWLAKNCVVFLYQTPPQIYPAVVSRAPYSSEISLESFLEKKLLVIILGDDANTSMNKPDWKMNIL